MLSWVREQREAGAAAPRTAAAEDALARVHAKRGVFAVSEEMKTLLLQNQEELLSAKDDLGLRERLCLAAMTRLSVEDALKVDVNELGPDYFHAHAIRAQHLFRADLGPRALLRFGVLGAQQMRDLGVDSLELAMLPPIAEECALAYGAASCRETWLVTSMDAINLSNTDAATHLEASLERLLEVCDALPVAAFEVIRQQPAPGLAIRGVRRETLLATGIVISQLTEAAVFLTDLMAAGYTPNELTQLGVSAFRL